MSEEQKVATEKNSNQVVAEAGVATGVFTSPVPGKTRVTSEYTGPNATRKNPVDGVARPHKGIDLAGNKGDSQVAADGGIVTYAGPAGKAGNVVVIDHGNGVVTRYFHLDSVSVKVGQPIAKGQEIGKTGSTGNSTGPHCHWEVLRGATIGVGNGLGSNLPSVNPRQYLRNGNYSNIMSQSSRPTSHVHVTQESTTTNQNTHPTNPQESVAGKVVTEERFIAPETNVSVGTISKAQAQYNAIFGVLSEVPEQFRTESIARVALQVTSTKEEAAEIVSCDPGQTKTSAQDLVAKLGQPELAMAS